MGSWIRSMIGAQCWTKRLWWVRDGRSGEHHGSAIELRLRKSTGNYICQDCGRPIVKGSLHGAGADMNTCSLHFCIGCLSPVKPANGTKPADNPPTGEEGIFIRSDDIPSEPLGLAEQDLPRQLDVLCYGLQMDTNNQNQACPSCNQPMAVYYTGKKLEWHAQCRNPQCPHLVGVLASARSRKGAA